MGFDLHDTLVFGRGFRCWLVITGYSFMLHMFWMCNGDAEFG